jgi:hypothetical protein
MNQEPDNPVLIQLREIRATLAGHTARFDRLERGLNELRHFVDHALGLSTIAEPGTRELDARHEQGEVHRKGMDERVSSIEQRVAKIEERLDG